MELYRLALPLVHTRKKPRQARRERIGQKCRITKIHRLELLLVHTSEMTLDYSFLSDSRNFFV